MTTIRKFYEQHVETQWSDKLPQLTEVEAERAAKRLYRFVFKKACKLKVVITSGRNHSYIRNGVLRVNPTQGWDNLVHGLSHSFYRRLHPGAKPHSGQHGSLERHMIQHAIASGWLDGKLKPVSNKQPTDEQLVRYERVLASMGRWESKAKRAENALKKLATKRKYYEKKYNYGQQV